MNDMTSNPLIITVAPNGAYKLAADHAAVPLTAQSLAATAKASSSLASVTPC